MKLEGQIDFCGCFEVSTPVPADGKCPVCGSLLDEIERLDSGDWNVELFVSCTKHNPELLWFTGSELIQ